MSPSDSTPSTSSGSPSEATPRPRGLDARREAVVREHMASENEHRFDDTLSTFAHPRYELIGTGQVYDGVDEVLAYYATSRQVFPDQRNEVRSLHVAGHVVVVEFDLLGTHRGSLLGEEPSGRGFRCPMVALFEFGADTGGDPDKIVCERVYFDSETVYRQLRAEDPSTGT